MPTIVTLVYHAYKNFEVPNKIAKMMDDGTLKWRSHHGVMYYTDEDGKEKKIEADSEFVAWENHDEFNVEETEESDEEDDDNKSVHSTCCVECGESFKFDAPVSAEDYHNGKHDQHCPSCEEEQEEEEEKPMDGDGFVICTNCGVGGGKCRGDCEEEEEKSDTK
jgi:hypothetical protein